jgi:hypothetical protein
VASSGALIAARFHQLRVRAVLVRDPVVLQLDEQVLLPEDVLQPSCDCERPGLVVLEQRFAAPGRRGSPSSR